MVNLGVIYNTQLSFGQPERAREMFERAIRLAPDYALAWLNLGHYCGFQGGCRELGNVVDKVLASNTEETITINKGYLNSALKCYEQAFKLDSSLKKSFQECVYAIKALLEFAENQKT